MADREQKVIRSLPPISPRSKSDKPQKGQESIEPTLTTAVSDGSRRRRRLERKMETLESSVSDKANEVSQNDVSNNGIHTDKPLKRRKKKASSSEAELTPENTQSISQDESVTSKPPRRKKKAISETSENESEIRDSVLDKLDSDPIVPKKKPRKKKQPRKLSNNENYPDSGFAAELTSMEDDIVDGDLDVPSETNIHQTTTTTTILKSVPTQKLFIETDSGFKGENKSRVAKRLAEEKPIEEVSRDVPKYTTLDFALSVHRVVLCGDLFIHGLTAGIAFWHIVIVYTLSASSSNILVLYEPLALPVQCMFYLLFALCTISAMDRSDVGHMTRQFFVRAITLQSSAPAVLLYFIALVLSLGIVGVEDQLNIWRDYQDHWLVNKTTITLTNEFSFNIQVWKNVNTARGVAAILGWFVLSIVPKYDRLSKNLKADDNVIHAVDVYP